MCTPDAEPMKLPMLAHPFMDISTACTQSVYSQKESLNIYEIIPP